MGDIIPPVTGKIVIASVIAVLLAGGCGVYVLMQVAP